MLIAIVSLAVIAIVELVVIWALLNRLLLQAAIRPIEIPQAMTFGKPIAPPIERAAPVKRFTVPIQS